MKQYDTVKQVKRTGEVTGHSVKHKSYFFNACVFP